MESERDCPVLKAAGLSKHYGKRLVVDDVSLEVRRGDVFGFLGPNGAGKSTTIRMLTGLVRPDHGVVEILGHDLRRAHNKALARVGAVVEAPSLYPHLTGEQNLKLLAALAGGASEKRRREVLRLVGLDGREKDRVRCYSHGMKQRLALAQALLPHPELILLDEPTNGLDPGGMAELRSLLRNLAAQEGLTIFLSSHLLSEVEQICTRVAVIAQGRILVQDAVQSLLANTSAIRVAVEPRTQAISLLQELPWIQAIHEDGEMLRVEAPMERTAELNAALVTAGCQVSALIPARQSLEEYYLNLVEQRP
ncbi:MAG TPA: ABC transporter ATP-binding protein [Armatimonadota bacterium]|nr:ABC transporter ATP-binding protein [Armatimonadota bacterium]